MIKIEPYPIDESKPYTHLIPIVEALIEDGNSPETKEMFYSAKGDWICKLKKPIDFSYIKSKFEIPSTINLSEEHNSILCKNTWTSIEGGKR